MDNDDSARLLERHRLIPKGHSGVELDHEAAPTVRPASFAPPLTRVVPGVSNTVIDKWDANDRAATRAGLWKYAWWLLGLGALYFGKGLL